jgi:excisionase family DNA binding protein
MPNQPAMLKVPEVAARLGISTSKAWELSRSGRLPIVRIGKSVRVPADALDKWIAARTEGAV